MAARETNLVNAFETTLAAQLASGGTSMNLAVDPGVDAPAYFVIDPDNDSNREIVLWASGTNHAAATVTRDIDSKHGTDPTHASGTTVRLAVVKQHIDEVHDAVQQGFVLEDDDGTEVAIAPAVASGVYTAREVKFIGAGVDIDWTDVTHGTDGDPYDLTFTLDINDLAAGAVAQAADSIAILDADDNATKKESIADFVEAINGTGLTASSGVLNVNAAQAVTSLTGGDLTIYEDANNADVSLKMGTSATEAFSIEVLNGGSDKTNAETKVMTTTASGTANHGKISVYIDEVEILDIDDGGIDLAAGMTFAINGTDVIVTDTTYSGGTGLTLSTTTFNVDASQAITALTGGDLTIYEDANNADVSLKLGTSATEALSIEVLNGGSNKTAEEIKIKTSTASGTANHGKISFYVDDVEIMDIDDGGIDMASGKTIEINGTAIGGKVLQVVTALDTGDTTATTSTSYVDTNLGATITPANSSNKILVFANQMQSFTPDGSERISMSCIERSISGGADTVIHEKGMGSHATTTARHSTATFIHLDSPSTTAATTYKIQSKIEAGAFRHNENFNATIDSNSSTSTMTLVEIEG